MSSHAEPLHHGTRLFPLVRRNCIHRYINRLQCVTNTTKILVHAYGLFVPLAICHVIGWHHANSPALKLLPLVTSQTVGISYPFIVAFLIKPKPQLQSDKSDFVIHFLIRFSRSCLIINCFIESGPSLLPSLL